MRVGLFDILFDMRFSCYQSLPYSKRNSSVKEVTLTKRQIQTSGGGEMYNEVRIYAIPPKNFKDAAEFRDYL